MLTVVRAGRHATGSQQHHIDGLLPCARAAAMLLSRPQLQELKQELGGLRVAKVTGGAPNKLSKM
jgi:hypothetical protein